MDRVSQTTNTTTDQVFIITLLLGNELPSPLPNNLQTMQVFPSYVTCSQSLVVKYHHYLPLFASIASFVCALEMHRVYASHTLCARLLLRLLLHYSSCTRMPTSQR